MKKLFLTMIFLLIITACAPLNSTIISDISVDKLGKIAVMKYEADKHDIDVIIAKRLIKMGYNAVAGEKEQVIKDFNTIVTYQNSWAYGVSTGSFTLEIQFKNGKTKEMIAYGKSMKDNFMAELAKKKGSLPVVMIEETLTKILQKKKIN